MAVATRRHVYSILDGKGEIGTAQVFSNHALPADASSFNNGLKVLIEPLITGTIESWGYWTQEGTDASTPAVNSDRQEKASFTFNDADTFQMLLSIPTINEGIFIPGTKDVNFSNPDVAAFVTSMLANATTQRAIDLVSVAKGKEVFK